MERKIITALTFAGVVALAGCTVSETPAEPAPVTSTENAAPSESPTESPAPTPPPEAVEPDGTRSNPWLPGTVASYTSDSVWSYAFGTTNIDQWQAIVAVNEFSAPPSEGNTYITVPVTLSVADTEQTAVGVDAFGSLNITYVTASGKSGKECFVQLPAPGDLLDVGILYGGASVEFLACAEVPANEVTGGTWAVRSSIAPENVTFFVGAS